jgi:tRNA(fMet)-specific endonuclease VapC
VILLDTDICVDLLRGTSPAAARRLLAAEPGGLRIPAVAAAELLFGARKGGSDKALRLTREFIAQIGVAAFDGAAAEQYGALRERQRRSGTVIGPNDLLIAATALALGAVLATANTAEFSRVSGLVVENWRDPPLSPG